MCDVCDMSHLIDIPWGGGQECSLECVCVCVCEYVCVCGYAVCVGYVMGKVGR